MGSSIGVVASGKMSDIFREMGAVFAIDAADSIVGEQWVLNQGSGGQVLRARYGSVPRAELRNGIGLVTPGAATDYAAIADAASLDIIGDVDLIVRVAMDSWPPTQNSTLIGKWTTSNLSYGFAVLAAGTLLVYNTADGTTNINRGASTVTLPATTAGATLWLRATIDVDNGSGGNDARYYWAPDSEDMPTSWTQLGSTVTTAGTTSIFSGTAQLLVGAANVINAPPAIFKRAIVRNGIDGPIVFDADFTKQTNLASSFTGTHGIGIKNSALVLPGMTGVYATLPDAAALDLIGDHDIAMDITAADWTPSTTQWLFAKGSGGVSGGAYALSLLSTGQLSVATTDGTTPSAFVSSVAVPGVDGQRLWVRYTLDIDNGSSQTEVRFYTSSDGITWAQLGTPQVLPIVTIQNNANLFSIGAVQGGFVGLVGSIRRVIVKSGINGITVVDVTFAQADDTQSFTAGHGIGIKAGAFVTPGSTGIYANVGTALPVPTTSFRFEADLTLPDWTPATQPNICYVSGDFAFLELMTTGALNVFYYDASVTLRSVGSVAVPVTDGQRWQVAVDVTTTGIATFYTRPDASAAWVQLGTPQATGGTGFRNIAGTLSIGAYNAGTGRPLAGRIHRIAYSVDGTVVRDVPFSGQPDDTQSFTCPTGQTVTINGAARPTVTVNGCARPVVSITAANAVDTNDPLLLTHTGTNYIYYPDAAATIPTNRTTSPAVAYNTTGDVEFIVQTKGIDWSNATSRTIAGSWNTGFNFYRLNATQVNVINSNSTSNCYAVCTHGLSGVQDQWFRLRYIKSTGTWTVGKSTDGSAWTDITGATNTPSPGVNFPNFTQPIEVGGSDDLGAIGARVPFVEMRNGIGGAALFRYSEADITNWNNLTSWVSSTGETWTITRAATGRKTTVVTRPVWLFGTDDYMEVADNNNLDVNAAEELSVVAVGRAFAPPTGGVIVAKATSVSSSPTEKRWALRYSASNIIYSIVDDGVALNVTTRQGAAGNLEVNTFTLSATEFSAYVGNSISGPSARIPGDARNALVMRIGANVSGGNFNDGEVMAVAVFRKSLSAAEIAAIVSTFGASS